MNDIRIGKKVIRILPEWKTGFLATWIIGLLAHAYRFFNFLPTWDSMFNFTGTGATFWSGRCFLGYFSGISSKYDMPWVNGALSLFYISIAVVMLIDLFEIRQRLYCVLLAGLVVSFPTVTSTFAYMFTADGYMMAFLLSVMGIWLTCKFKHGVWFGAVCIGLSMGTYQAYISVTLMVVLLVALKALLIDKKTFKTAFLEYWKCLAAVVGGAVFYKVVDSLFNIYYGITLTGYQGIDSVGILTLAQYKEALRKTFSALAHLWCLHNGLLHTNKYGLVNAAVVGGILLGTVILIVKNKTYKDIAGVIVTVIAVIVMPLAAFSVNFVSPGTSYHTLMEMGVCFIYLLLLLYIAKGGWEKKAGRALQVLGVLVLAFLCYFNTINANIAYNSMNLSYEKSYAVCSNILDRIEQLDEYPEISKVVLIGDYHAVSGGIDELTPQIMGVSQDIYLKGDYHYISMWNYCFGRSFAMATGAEKEAIRQTEEYQSLDVYPARNCVAVINDTIVVKLSE